MMRKIVIGLAAAALVTAGSTLSASAIPGGGGADGGGGAYVDVVRFGGGGFGGGGFGTAIDHRLKPHLVHGTFDSCASTKTRGL